MDEYITLGIYMGMLVTVALGGLLWNKYRAALKRRFSVANYSSEDQPHHGVRG